MNLCHLDYAFQHKPCPLNLICYADFTESIQSFSQLLIFNVRPHVFVNNGNSDVVSQTLCKEIAPDPVEGQYLLTQILDGGNFGRYSDGKRQSRFLDRIFKNLRYVKHYPMELLWSPLWKIYELYWINKYK